MRALAATLALLSLAACAASTWQWRRPDGSLAEDQLKEDIDACEEYALIADMGHPGFEGTLGARPRGGWGNFSFERCMHERNWALTRVKP